MKKKNLNLIYLCALSLAKTEIKKENGSIKYNYTLINTHRILDTKDVLIAELLINGNFKFILNQIKDYKKIINSKKISYDWIECEEYYSFLEYSKRFNYYQRKFFKNSSINNTLAFKGLIMLEKFLKK